MNNKNVAKSSRRLSGSRAMIGGFVVRECLIVQRGRMPASRLASPAMMDGLVWWLPPDCRAVGDDAEAFGAPDAMLDRDAETAEAAVVFLAAPG